jgi:threonine/homoserine/homoserine lactone efflux protein
MTILFILLKGFILGFSVASSIGPICILCIKRTLEKGLVSGISSAFGVALADGFYGLIAVFGLTIVANFMAGFNSILKILGGLFLLYIGIKTILKTSENHRGTIPLKKNKGLIKDFISIFLLTLTNPMTIFSFMAIFAGLGIAGYEDNLLSAITVLGVFLGSLIWYISLLYCISLIGHRITEKTMRKIDIVSGIIILLFGLTSLVGLFL